MATQHGKDMRVIRCPILTGSALGGCGHFAEGVGVGDRVRMSQTQCLLPLKSVGLIGTHLPRRCGIGVFNSHLCEAIAGVLAPKGTTYAVAVNDTADGYHYPDRVGFEIAANLPQEYRYAAEFLNMHEADGVILQHEFGIYGGPAGSHVLRLFARTAHAGDRDHAHRAGPSHRRPAGPSFRR